jgi:2-polyprenyl-6-hydroxyphenyl methylase/3-demethylubiquinone-9 3-methyltransferase
MDSVWRRTCAKDQDAKKSSLLRLHQESKRRFVSEATDRNLSNATQEFVWEDAEVPEAHSYLISPTVKALRELRAGAVLDLGCGNGSFSALLQSENFLVVGCDSSASGIALARRAHPTIDFFEHDISNPLPASFAGVYDAVVSLEVVEHLMQPRHLVARAYSALRPGGVLIMSTPYHGYWKNLSLALTNKFDSHRHPLRDFGHVKFFSRRTLSQLVHEAGFSVRDFLRVGRIPAFACSMIVVAVKPE